MAKTVYQCSKCYTTYNKLEEAEYCESQHRDHKNFSISHVNYEQCGRSYGMGLHSKRTIPRTVTIKFSDQHGDFATYTLEHVGFVGL